jgi:hypothetical protein
MISTPTVYCMNCGTPHPSSARYCVKCGQPLANEFLGKSAAPLGEAIPAPLLGGVPNTGKSIPSVEGRKSSPYAVNLSFRSLQGRTIILGVFAVAWFLQAARGVVDHLPVAWSFAESLGWSLGFSPVIVLFAWLLWRLLFKGERGRFAFSLAVATAMFSAYVLIAGRNW